MRRSRSSASAFVLRMAAVGGLCLSCKGRGKARSTLLEDFLRPGFRPSLAERADANPRSVLGVDQRMRGDVVVDLEQPEFRRRQPGQCLGDIAWKDLPR